MNTTPDPLRNTRRVPLPDTIAATHRKHNQRRRIAVATAFIVGVAIGRRTAR